MRIASLLLVATSLTMLPPPTAMAAKPGDLSFELASNLPIALGQYVLSERALDPYELAAPLNPFYLQGDLNGDGRSDFAIWIREVASGKRGLLILHGGTRESFVLAAGKAFDTSRDNFSAFNSWYIFPKGKVTQSAFSEKPPPELLGDALLLAVLEASDGLIYWTGSRYSWYQQGD